MLDPIPTVKIMPSAPEQGAFVIINADDYRPDIHTLYVEGKSPHVAPPIAQVIAPEPAPIDAAPPADPTQAPQFDFEPAPAELPGEPVLSRTEIMSRLEALGIPYDTRQGTKAIAARLARAMKK